MLVALSLPLNLQEWKSTVKDFNNYGPENMHSQHGYYTIALAQCPRGVLTNNLVEEVKTQREESSLNNSTNRLSLVLYYSLMTGIFK